MPFRKHGVTEWSHLKVTLQWLSHSALPAFIWHLHLDNGSEDLKVFLHVSFLTYLLAICSMISLTVWSGNYRCTMRKGKMMTAPLWTFWASFCYELQFISFCVFPILYVYCHQSPTWTFPSIHKTSRCQQHSPCFLPPGFGAYAHPRAQMQWELLHTKTFPWSPSEAEGGPGSLCLASIISS